MGPVCGKIYPSEILSSIKSHQMCFFAGLVNITFQSDCKRFYIPQRFDNCVWIIDWGFRRFTSDHMGRLPDWRDCFSCPPVLADKAVRKCCSYRGTSNEWFTFIRSLCPSFPVYSYFGMARKQSIQQCAPSWPLGNPWVTLVDIYRAGFIAFRDFNSLSGHEVTCGAFA